MLMAYWCGNWCKSVCITFDDKLCAPTRQPVKTVAGKTGLTPITKNIRDVELFTFDIPYRGMVI
jgi:hypothetical protein